MRLIYKPSRAAKDRELRPVVSARFLLAPPQAAPIVPADFPITQCPARVAQGARKPRMSNGFKGAQTTKNIAASAARTSLLAYASKGMNHHG